jgi:hypothetical protein
MSNTRLRTLWPVFLIHTAVLSAFSAAGSLLFNTPPPTPLITNVCCGFAMFWMHAAGHTKRFRMPWWFEAHAEGHHKLYSPGHSLASTYLVNVYDRYNLNLWMYVVALAWCLTALKVAFAWTSGETALQALLVLLLAQIENLVHQECHLQKSALHRFQWFHTLQMYHLVHHAAGANCHFAIVQVMFDVVSGTCRFKW